MKGQVIKIHLNSKRKLSGYLSSFQNSKIHNIKNDNYKNDSLSDNLQTGLLSGVSGFQISTTHVNSKSLAFFFF